MQQFKRLWRSKTFWLGVLSIAEPVIDAVINGLNWRQVLLAGFGALFILLRTQTSAAIGKGPEEQQ